MALTLLFALRDAMASAKETVVIQKRMFKVISPIDKKDGSTYWLRCGTGYVNKDNSINIYLDAIPCSGKDRGVTLQIRELTEDDMRERSEKRASYSSRGTLDPTFMTSPAAPQSSAANDNPPF
jgi:hypothetical protein